MTGFLRQLWASASAPEHFFRWLEPQPTRTVRGGAVAYGSLALLSLACALGLARLTRSDAPLLFAFFALVGSSGFFLYAWGFGSIFVQRAGTLDLRTWEVTGWCWTPALFGALSLLLPLFFFPLPALVVAVFGVLVWHLMTLRGALQVFLGGRATRVVTIYGLYVYALPLVLFGFVVWFSAQFIG